ncbi:rab GTPase-binding effector protein 1-like isoform X4 [Branchiostoma floridae]|uniref:Rab GTPase-binding effector protein 1-like isoform X4 n=1 Tax=Branchiostoma floridae TaxID=7739 RepID=A0A9J7N5I9_BRAFL|nr:rab GTPase-binding effector protein 1-like isoform X4 [Branchiostoma floridae]
MEQEDIANADVDTLRSRVEELQKEKNEMEKDFAQKRGKFKEIFLAKEEELRKEHQKRGEYQQTVDSLQKQVQTLQAEVDDLKTTNTILETTKQDEVDEIRRKCQEEIASLQAIMKEAARDASQATASKYESRFEEERSRWSRYQEKMEQQLQELKEKMAEPKEESVLASVAKSLRMVSMGASPSSTTTSTSTSLSTEDENLEAHMKKAQEEAEMLRSVVMPMEKEITSLKEKLRLSQDRIRELEGRPRAATVSDPTSVEVPTVDTGIRASTSEVLLKEGEDLGEKVRELNHYLEVEKSSRTDLEMYVAVLNTQKTVLQEDADKLRSELHDVCRLLEEEKRKHAELKKTWELANDQFLESQRLMLADLKRMSGVLSEEQQRQVQELQKQDAEREAQQKRIQQLQQMRDEQERLQQQQQQQREFFSTFLAPLQSTPRAKELVGEQSDSSATSTPTQEVKSQATTTSSLSPPAVVKSQEPSKEFQPKPPPPAVVIQLNMKEVKPEPPSPAPPMRKKRLQRLLSGPEAVPKLSSSKTSLGSSSARSSTASISTQKSEESAHSPSTEEAIIRRTQSSSCIEGDTLNVGSMSLLERPKSAENLASSQSSEEFGPFVSGDEDRVSQLSFTLTEAQQKAITAQTPENEEVQTLVAAAKASSSEPSASMVGKRLVSDKEWEWLQQEVKAAREKLGRPCDMCSNYEQQLQNVQESEKDVRDTMAKLQSDLEREQKNREKREKNMEELEESVKNAGQDAQQQLTYFTFKHEESEKFLTDVRQQFLRWQNDTTEQMKLLVESREQVYNELQRLQRENDSLQGKYTLHKSLQQSEGFVMPQGLEELQTLISRYRQNILTVKTSAEHMEDKLRSEIMFLKDRVKAEQVAKDNIEETLSSDLDVARDEMVKLQNIKTDYDKEKTEKTELEAKLNELQQSKKSIETKSKQVITALQQQVEELTALKTKLEAEVRDLRVKIQGLQADLDNSEAVQRDFVKLSQSLQVQLENIRQSENEVRWQHEEDATGCHQCKQPFQPKKKATKHHCRHCGKIFCNDCLSKSVQSGPNMRPSKVCDVCYTILVNDSAPYFSTTPPTTA